MIYFRSEYVGKCNCSIVCSQQINFNDIIYIKKLLNVLLFKNGTYYVKLKVILISNRITNDRS